MVLNLLFIGQITFHTHAIPNPGDALTLRRIISKPSPEECTEAVGLAIDCYKTVIWFEKTGGPIGVNGCYADTAMRNPNLIGPRSLVGEL